MKDSFYTEKAASSQSRPHVSSCDFQKFRGIPIWLGVLLIGLAVTCWLAWDAFRKYNDLLQQEYHVLEIQARQAESRVSGALRSVDLVLGSIIRELQEEPQKSIDAKKQLVRNSLKLLPEVRSILIADNNGKIQVHTIEATVGFDASAREYFTVHKAAPEDDSFHISAPFITSSTGIMATQQSRVVRDSIGEFAGVVAATLDSVFFKEVLKLSLAQPEVQILLINLNGEVLNSQPSDLAGKSLKGDIAYTEHIQSGQSITRYLNVTKLESIKRLSVFCNVPNSTLAVIVSRDYSSVTAAWLHSMYDHVIAYALLILTMLFVSWLAIQRQDAFIQSQRQLTESELQLRTIIDSEPECVKQLSVDGSLLQMNRAGLDMIGADSLDQVLGKKMHELVNPEYQQAFLSLTKKVFSGETCDLIFKIQGLKGAQRWLETHAAPLRNSENEIVALLAVTRDITERKRIECELQTESRRLQTLLDEVKTLRGIVPICANCKNVRDDKGFWSQVEKYVSAHTEAKFSHSICPSCSHELYPDLYDESGIRRSLKKSDEKK